MALVKQLGENKLLWRSTFNTLASERRLGVTTVGTPVWKNKSGVGLTAGTYLYYPAGKIFTRWPFSVRLEFTPNFVLSADTQWVYLGSPGPTTPGMDFLYFGSSSVWRVASADLGFTTAPFVPYKKNVFVGAFDGTNERIYLNGVLVSSAGPYTLTPTFAPVLTVGKIFYADYFEGTIHSLEFWNKTLTIEDSIVSYSGPSESAYWSIGPGPHTGELEYDDVPTQGSTIVDDGDMEAVGTASWTPSNAAVAKVGSPYQGTQCLRVTATGANAYVTPTINRQQLWALYSYRVAARASTNARPKLYNAVDIWTGAYGSVNPGWQIATVRSMYSGQIQLKTDGPVGEYVDWDIVEVLKGGYITDPNWDAQYDVDYSTFTQSFAPQYSGTLTRVAATHPDAKSGDMALRYTRAAGAGQFYEVTMYAFGDCFARGWCRGDGTTVPAIRNDVGSYVFWIAPDATNWHYFEVPMYSGPNQRVVYYQSAAGWTEWANLETFRGVGGRQEQITGRSCQGVPTYSAGAPGTTLPRSFPAGVHTASRGYYYDGAGGGASSVMTSLFNRQGKKFSLVIAMVPLETNPTAGNSRTWITFGPTPVASSNLATNISGGPPASITITRGSVNALFNSASIFSSLIVGALNTLIFTWDGATGNAYCYVNGELKQTLTGLTWNNLQDVNTIKEGYATAWYYFALGHFRRFNSYNYVLSQNQVIALHNKYKSERVVL